MADDPNSGESISTLPGCNETGGSPISCLKLADFLKISNGNGPPSDRPILAQSSVVAARVEPN
jgi:hypothetical protein